MSRATLAVILSKLSAFPKPKMYFEQYITPSEAAATILWDAHMRGLLSEKHIIDLGAGTGILGIGALILGAKHVSFIELDASLTPTIMENIQQAQETVSFMGSYEIITTDVSKGLSITGDLCLTNPPFGTKEKHADISFLKAALTTAPECYSFHKTPTLPYLRTWLMKERAYCIQEFPFTFNLGNTMQQHEKKAHHVAITCIHSRKDL
jgi:putative methylase